MARSDPRQLTKLSEILKCLSELQAEETQLSNSLGTLISAQSSIDDSLDRLTGLLPELVDLHQNATVISNDVSQTAKTAHRVGSRVRSLDEEMRRVREAAERVNQVMDLKSSLRDLEASISARDWETAALHCARAMALPSNVIAGPFAEKAVPTEESHLPPVQTLDNARQHLLSVFRHNFEKASAARDSTATSRFFKLFPAIGWEAEGLQAYADFVTELIRMPAGSSALSSLYYVTSMTALFESIARIVDQHQPVVEKYYGAGKMKGVIDHLLKECDRRLHRLIEDWEEDKAVRRKLTEIARSLPTSIESRARQPAGDEDVVDHREIEALVSEIAGMANRWNLFRKFLSDSLRDDDSESESQLEETTESKHTSSDEVVMAQFHDMEKTESHNLIETTLANYYLPLEVWYVRTAIDKAHRMSFSDLSQSPPSTTVPDDVFYVLKLVLTRLLSTGSLPIVERTLEQFRDIVDKDYNQVFKRKLDDVYRPNVQASSRGEKAEREGRVSFVVVLNDLDISSSHLDRLVRDISLSVAPQHFLPAEEREVTKCITNFSNVNTKLKGTLRGGIEQLFNQLVRPRLRTFLPDVYKDISYILDDEAYSNAEANDIVRKRFVKAWEGILEGYKDIFTDNNHRHFFGQALEALLKPWEKFLLGLKYSELGAIRFDTDLRAIVSYLAAQPSFGDIREKFTRMQQISMILNLDAEEDVDEFFNNSGISWKLSLQEARNVAALKT